jgi:RHS repeat-associated protein
VYDGLGSVVGEVDPLGNLTSSPKYDVYGAVRSNGGSASSKQGFVGSLGHITDDTGLIYMRARYYDSNLGRFISQDPGYSGNNWFDYCDNNPVNKADANGNNSEVLGLIKFALDIWSAYKLSGGSVFNDLKKLREARKLALSSSKVEGEQAAAKTAIADRQKVLGDETGAALAGGDAGRSAIDAATEVSAAETINAIEETIEGESGDDIEYEK